MIQALGGSAYALPPRPPRREGIDVFCGLEMVLRLDSGAVVDSVRVARGGDTGGGSGVGCFSSSMSASTSSPVSASGATAA